MEKIELNKAYIKTIYKRNGNETSELNPGKVEKNKRYALFNRERVFYIVRCPTAVGGYKLGKAGKGDVTDVSSQSGGGARLRSYWNAYGYAKGFYILQVIVMRGRGVSQGGEDGKEHRWAESKFEFQVLRYLRKKKIKPIRGNEYFEKLEDIQTAVDFVIKRWTFNPTKVRKSKRRLALYELDKQDYKQPKIGDMIEYRWDKNKWKKETWNVKITQKLGNALFVGDYSNDKKYTPNPDFKKDFELEMLLNKGSFSNALKKNYTFRFKKNIKKQTQQRLEAKVVKKKKEVEVKTPTKTVPKPAYKKTVSKVINKVKKVISRVSKISKLSKLERALKKLGKTKLVRKHRITDGLTKRQRALQKINKNKK
jgi:hypothetical protein